MVTRFKDLRTGRPVWAAYRMPSISTLSLKRDISADIAVIGAGVSGAMVAETLSAMGLSVVILDRRTPVRGSTFASTCLLQYELDLPLIRLARKTGFEDAARAWRRAKLALESLAAKIEGLNIRCDLQHRKSLYLSGDILNADGLEKERAARALIGVHTDFVTKRQLKDQYGIHHDSALISYNTMSANPLQLTAGFLTAAQEQGARIYSKAIVADIECTRNKCHLMTEEGPVISVKNVIFATGYELPKKLKVSGHVINSTYAFATKPQASRLKPDQPMAWEASRPYLYISSTADGRIICGGADENFSDEKARDALLSEKTALLQKKLGHLLPHVDAKAEYAWAGSFGTSKTGLPTIGKIPSMPHCYGILGFGGNGITFSRAAAEIIAADIAGKQDPEADLFAFKRQP